MDNRYFYGIAIQCYVQKHWFVFESSWFFDEKRVSLACSKTLVFCLMKSIVNSRIQAQRSSGNMFRYFVEINWKSVIVVWTKFWKIPESSPIHLKKSLKRVWKQSASDWSNMWHISENQCIKKKIWKISEKSLKNLWKISEKSLKNLWKISENLWKISENLWKISEKSLKNLWKISEKSLKNLWTISEKSLKNLWKSLENLWKISEKSLKNLWKISEEMLNIFWKWLSCLAMQTL